MLLTYLYRGLVYNLFSYTSWSGLTLTMLLMVTVLKIVHDRFRLKGSHLPPKTWTVPILGNMLLLSGNINEKLLHLGEKYGDVFRVNLGGTETVVLNSFDAIKQAYVVQGRNFNGVPKKNSILRWLTDGAGIFTEDGPMWQADRKFILHTFRDFGLGKRTLESKVQSVAVELIRILQKLNGRPYDISPLLFNCAANVICSLMFNKRYDLQDPEFQQILKDAHAAVSYISGFLGFYPLGPLVYLLPHYWRLRKAKQCLLTLSKRLVGEHEASLSTDSPKDYVEAYLQQMNQLEKYQSQERKYFSREQLIANSVNFLLAGVVSAANTMVWAPWLLILHPEMQEKIWKEIESTVGTEHIPNFDQRNNMPFFEAFMMEVQRYVNIAPNGLFHRTSEDTTLKGYTIPKDTPVVANLWAVHKDRKYWTDPDTFNPYRFLDKNGNVVRNEGLIPFSAGKRRCLGESLATIEIFIFLAGMLQKFVFKAPTGVDLSNLRDHRGFLRFLQPYKLCAVPRTEGDS